MQTEKSSDLRASLDLPESIPELPRPRDNSLGAAAFAVHFGTTLRDRGRRHELRQMLPVSADVAAQVLTHAATVLGMTPAEFVRDALSASDASGHSPLLEHGWLLAELLNDASAVVLVPAAATVGESLTLDEKGRLVLQMVLALLRQLVRAPSLPRLMLLLNLDAGSDTDTHDGVHIWTWRLAMVISDAISVEPLPVVLCIVTSPVLAVQQDAEGGSTADEESREHQPGVAASAVLGSGSMLERARAFSLLMTAAVRSNTCIKLAPLTKDAQHSYALQVLRAKYSYSGTLDGVAADLLEFVVSRSGGKPIFIEQMFNVLDQAELLNFDEDEDMGVEIVRDVDVNVLNALDTPQNICSEALQLFEALDPALQAALRLAAPMEFFSEAMLTDVGLPSRIVSRLAHLFTMAVDMGILDVYTRGIPQDVLAADPNAHLAWGWRIAILREEVLRAMLATEVQRVWRKVQELRAFHRSKDRSSKFPRRMTRRSSYDMRDSAPIWRSSMPQTNTREQGVQCDLVSGGTHGGDDVFGNDIHWGEIGATTTASSSAAAPRWKQLARRLSRLVPRTRTSKAARMQQYSAP